MVSMLVRFSSEPLIGVSVEIDSLSSLTTAVSLEAGVSGDIGFNFELELESVDIDVSRTAELVSCIWVTTDQSKPNLIIVAGITTIMLVSGNTQIDYKKNLENI